MVIHKLQASEFAGFERPGQDFNVNMTLVDTEKGGRSKKNIKIKISPLKVEEP